ncbi:unnamed protein product [Caenorhabditis bovis]|uniref:Carbohydrate kinase FGGY N-terminal domain-containing protein n=1 Tax=Caenorhabditis bovis TaxID=2654633 RepID=A0A8S1ENI4_9PELO|nr:unnamed protein product [Caenorhabditis bovis]
MSAVHVAIGIDIGTSSAKICGIAKNGIITKEYRQNYGFECSAIQDSKRILRVCLDLLKNFDENVTDVWICGQMHGIALWNSQSINEDLENLQVSPLYNWMFTYDDEHFLESLPKWESGRVYPGFGIATLAYLHKIQDLKNFDRCGTIMELFSCYLTKSKIAFMSEHNAHSWAYCNNGCWQENIKQFLPSNVELPTITQDLSLVVGEWRRAKCHVASGDLQASVASLDFAENRAYLIIGTSAQLCALVSQNVTNLPPTVVNVPYSSKYRLVAACAMNGGNALEAMYKINRDKIYSNDNLVEILSKLDQKEVSIPDNLQINPIFIAERGSNAQFSSTGVENSSELELFFLDSRDISKLHCVLLRQRTKFRRHLVQLDSLHDLLSNYEMYFIGISINWGKW